jgi:hypothetical protein
MMVVVAFVLVLAIGFGLAFNGRTKRSIFHFFFVTLAFKEFIYNWSPPLSESLQIWQCKSHCALTQDTLIGLFNTPMKWPSHPPSSFFPFFCSLSQ